MNTQKTLREISIELRISHHTLRKYLGRLGITPARHPVDYRMRTLEDEELERLREMLDARPKTAPTYPLYPSQRVPAPRQVVAPVREASVVTLAPESPLRRTERQDNHAGATLRLNDLEPLPEGWIAYNTGFCRDHGGLDGRSLERSGFPTPHMNEATWRSHGPYPQPVKKAYDLEQHLDAARLAVQRWPAKFKPCEVCRNTIVE